MVREGVAMCGERRNDLRLVSNQSAVFINVVCLALSCFHILWRRVTSRLPSNKFR